MLPTISFLSSFLPIFSFVFFCLRNNTKELWVIFLYCVFSLLFDGFLFSSTWAFENKYLVWNIFAILEYTIITYFFYIIIQKRLVRILIVIFSIVYLVTFCIFATSNDDQFNSLLNAIGSVIILTLSLAFFVISMRTSEEPINLLSPVFLIVIALLLYVASTLFLYIIANRLTAREMEQYWGINHVSNILTNVIFAAAFLLFRFQKKNPSPENAAVDFTRSPDER